MSSEKSVKDLSPELRRLYKEVWNYFKENLPFWGIAEMLLEDPKTLEKIKKKVDQSKTPRETAIEEALLPAKELYDRSSDQMKKKSRERARRYVKKMIDQRYELLEEQRKLKKEVKELKKTSKERLIKMLIEALKEEKKLFPPFPIVQIDRVTSEQLLPHFLTKGIFSSFNQIPHIQDIIIKEEKKAERRLTAKEKRDLEIKTSEYKKDGYVWKEFSDIAIGFGYKHFKEYLDHIEKVYQEKKEEAKSQPFLYPEMKREIEDVLKDVKLYKQGQSLAYGILGELSLQKTYNGVSLPKERAVYYIGHTPEHKTAYHDVKEILSSLRWLDYRIVGRGDSEIRGAIGNFIYNILEKPKEYILDINPMYVGCIKHLFTSKELKSKKERKQLFSRGYFPFPLKALAISAGYSTATQEFRNYILREKGNRYLNTKKYKGISQKIRIYIEKAHLRDSKRERNYNAFTEEVLPTLMRDKFIAKIEPSLNKLKTLSPKIGYQTNLRVYMQKIKELDKSLEPVLKKKWENLRI